MIIQGEAGGFRHWEQGFRRDAAQDGLALFREHLRRLELPDEPEKLVNGTIMITGVCCAYLSLDGQVLTDFLAAQPYRLRDDSINAYAFTFNLFDQAYARILTPIDYKCLDLADLFEHPHHAYQRCGFTDLYVSRIDGRPLSGKEIEDVEAAITRDLRSDFSEDEVDFWTDPDSIEGVLKVCVYDIESE